MRDRARAPSTPAASASPPSPPASPRPRRPCRRLCRGAQAVRPADRRLPGPQFLLADMAAEVERPGRRSCSRRGSRTPAGRSRGRPDRQADRDRRGDAGDHRRRAGPRRQRLHPRLPRRAALPRRQGHPDLRGHQPDPAHGDRTRPAAQPDLVRLVAAGGLTRCGPAPSRRLSARRCDMHHLPIGAPHEGARPTVSALSLRARPRCQWTWGRPRRSTLAVRDRRLRRPPQHQIPANNVHQLQVALPFGINFYGQSYEPSGSTTTATSPSTDR